MDMTYYAVSTTLPQNEEKPINLLQEHGILHTQRQYLQFRYLILNRMKRLLNVTNQQKW